VSSATRAKAFAIAALLAAFAAYFAYCTVRDRTLERSFRALEQGASREDVLALLGTPDLRRAGCRDAPTWLNRPSPDAACAEELEYHAKLSSVQWTVGFDEAGRAIAKYRYLTR
jgi:hypothetical protein